MAVAKGQSVSRHVWKVFKGHGMFEGVLFAYDHKEHLYNIGYTDEDSEEITHAEVQDTILKQEEHIYLDGNIIEILRVRVDYDRIKEH